MSWQANTWAVEAGQRFNLTPPQRHILLILSNHHNHVTGQCYPKHGTVAAESGYARETILRAIRSFVDKGLLRAVRRKDEWGRDTSSEYFFVGLADPPQAHTGVSDDHTSVIPTGQNPSDDHTLNRKRIEEEINPKKDLSAELEKALQLAGPPTNGKVHHQPKPEEEWDPDDLWLREFLEQEQKLFTGPHLAALLNYEFWINVGIQSNGLNLECVRKAFASMANWFMDHPQRRPTPRGVRKRVGDWVKRDADYAVRNGR